MECTNDIASRLQRCLKMSLPLCRGRGRGRRKPKPKHIMLLMKQSGSALPTMLILLHHTARCTIV